MKSEETFDLWVENEALRGNLVKLMRNGWVNLKPK
jgi:hypothetical protein